MINAQDMAVPFSIRQEQWEVGAHAGLDLSQKLNGKDNVEVMCNWAREAIEKFDVKLNDKNHKIIEDMAEVLGEEQNKYLEYVRFLLNI